MRGRSRITLACVACGNVQMIFETKAETQAETQAVQSYEQQAAE
jgi:ribosomal protein S27E